MSDKKIANFEWFRALFLLRYKEAQKATNITPWYSLHNLLEAYKPLLQGYGLLERAFVQSWSNRVNHRIKYFNAIDQRTNSCRFLCR